MSKTEQQSKTSEIQNEALKKYNNESLISAMTRMVDRTKLNFKGVPHPRYEDAVLTEYCKEREPITLNLADGSIQNFVLGFNIWSIGAPGEQAQYVSDVFIFLDDRCQNFIAQRSINIRISPFASVDTCSLDSNLEVRLRYRRIGLGSALFESDALIHPLIKKIVKTINPNIKKIEIHYQDATSEEDKLWTTKQIERTLGLETDKDRVLITQSVDNRE